jgi:hypothetical protein
MRTVRILAISMVCQAASSLCLAAQVVPSEAKQALACETVADYEAFNLAIEVRADAEKRGAIARNGLEIYRAIVLTENLASASFDSLAPNVDHHQMYLATVARMQAYVNEDSEGANSHAKQFVPLCQRAATKMASEGKLSEEQVQSAQQAAASQTDALEKELTAKGYALEQ